MTTRNLLQFSCLVATLSFSSFFGPMVYAQETESDPIPNVEAKQTIDKIQYLEPGQGGQWIDITNRVYALKGTTVTFRAVPSSTDSAWPNDKPQWGGTSGATGTGETTSVTFSTLSPGLTVTAICDNTVSADVVVYDLQPVFTPTDDFEGRSYEDYGIGEDVNVSFNIITSATSSSTISASDIGGLELTIDNGDGSLTGLGSDGTGLYTVGTSEGTFSLSGKVKTGPSKGQSKPKQAKQVAPLPDQPTGANLSRISGTTTWHKANSASAGFAGEFFLLPNNVSFGRVRMREGTATATATGLLSKANGSIHSVGPVLSVSNVHTSAGVRVNATDSIGQYGPSAPYSTGNFTWPIPWYYRVVDANGVVKKSDTYFATATHTNTVIYSAQNNVWTATIGKKNAGPFYVAVNAATSNTGNGQVDSVLNGMGQVPNP